MTVIRIATLLIAVFAILASASAFTGIVGYPTTHKRCINRHHNLFSTTRSPLYATSEVDDDVNRDKTTDKIEDDIIPAPSSKYNDGDPRQALEQFGSLFSLVQEIFTDGSTWSESQLESKTQQFIQTYLNIFVPGLSYAITSLGVFGTTFLSIILALSISGRGYTDIISIVDGIEPMKNLLEKANPTWGNVAIALIGCEVLGPVILGVTLAVTPKTMDVLQTKLDEAGWGEDDIEKRAADILNLTS